MEHLLGYVSDDDGDNDGEEELEATTGMVMPTTTAVAAASERQRVLATTNQMAKFILAKVSNKRNTMNELDSDGDLKERMDASVRIFHDDMTFERVMAVLDQSQEQLMTDSGTTTKRKIYYSDVMLFDSKQEATNRAIEQTVEILAKVSNKWGSFARSSLAILAEKKGMVYGAVTWTMPTGSCFNGMLGTGLSIEPDMDGIEFYLEPEVESIIVVEKATVFRQLATEQSGLVDFTRTILVTGKGYPDVSTRLFLRIARSCRCGMR